MSAGAVVLLSGGQDSTICLAWALETFGRPLVSLTIDYGQRHRKEMHAARAVADVIGVDERRVIRLDLGGAIPSGLTEPRAEIAASGGINNLPTTYVPGRNFVFLGLAAGVAQTRGIDNIVIGCSEVDSSGYPDCRWPSLSAVTHALRLCLDFPRLQVAAPLLTISKADSLALAIDLGCVETLKYSWTCYYGEEKPCGTCPSCVIRAKGFEEAGMRWTISAAQYASEVRRFTDEIGELEWAAPQDWMCEPQILQQTGFSIAEHQRRTIASVLELRALDCQVVPVLQGWALSDYLDHVEMYEQAGVDLTIEPIVGVGSVCRRQHTAEAESIFMALAGLDIAMHGFGVKTQGLLKTATYLASADSMAWSLDGRRQPPLTGCSHQNCANCDRYALRWRGRLLQSLRGVEIDRPSQHEAPTRRSGVSRHGRMTGSAR